MESLTWKAQVSKPGQKTAIVAEYVLNDLGVFVKREKRVPKSAPLNRLTGFRVGYKAIPDTDYRAAPLDRNAILWKKVTAVVENGDGIRICGNRADQLELVVEGGQRGEVLRYIEVMRDAHPPVAAADFDAASWICWRDDDDWGDPFAPLSAMIAEELTTERFLDPGVMAETEIPDPLLPSVQAAGFCTQCGSKLYPDSRFCEKCGARVTEAE